MHARELPVGQRPGAFCHCFSYHLSTDRKQTCSEFFEQNVCSFFLLFQSGCSQYHHGQRSKSDLQEPCFDWLSGIQSPVTKYQCMRGLLFPGLVGLGQKAFFVIAWGADGSCKSPCSQVE